MTQSKSKIGKGMIVALSALALVLVIGAVLAMSYVGAYNYGNRAEQNIEAAWTNSDNLALLRLFLGGVRDNETRGGRLLGCESLNDNAILERLEGDRHGLPPLSR